MNENFFRFVINIFRVRKPSDYITRPLLLIACIVLQEALVGRFLFQSEQFFNVQEILGTVLIASPFVFLIYGLLNYQENTNQALSTAAQTDSLTGLPNRRAFIANSQEAYSRSLNGFYLIVDADNFKTVNDTYGHQIGDECLIQITKRLRSITLEEDLIGRIGGEEFAVVLFDRSLEELNRLARRLCHPITIELPSLPQPLRLTVSAGAAEILYGERPKETYARADAALLEAKDRGKSQMVLRSNDREDSKNNFHELNAA